MITQAPRSAPWSLIGFLVKASTYFTVFTFTVVLGCTSQDTPLSIASFSVGADSSVSGTLQKQEDLRDSLLVEDVPFFQDIRLQLMLHYMLFQLEQRNLPTEKISMSLVKLDSQCCSYAGFNDRIPRYPASLVKLFWLVNLYDQYRTNQLEENTVSEIDVHWMIASSDNDSASRIMDAITQTESGDRLPPEELEVWMNQRLALNQYFELFGYQDINISQKTFPISSLGLDFHTGREEQLRGNNSDPVRNYLTTYATARLLYEIQTDKILSPRYTQRIKSHLQREIYPTASQVQGFLGGGLPSNYHLYSKAGWTSSNRNDAAIIDPGDGKSPYILVVFGDDPAFQNDEQVFPLIAATIDQLMSNWDGYEFDRFMEDYALN
ncbi:MAG: serine hydrolase [Leptolyngbyaceae bacterium]|nr:serine hydrolase [Leptolyngbyaceae bacterium]